MMQSKIAHFQEAESRRPEYLKRAKRSRLESDHLVNEGRVSEENEENEPEHAGPVGITATPNRGRRLKLFQETSEESFEESLMAGGYGRYVSCMLCVTIASIGNLKNIYTLANIGLA